MRSPFWSIPAVHAPVDSRAMASVSLSVHDQRRRELPVPPLYPAGGGDVFEQLV